MLINSKTTNGHAKLPMSIYFLIMILYFTNTPLRAHKIFTEHLKVVNLRRP